MAGGDLDVVTGAFGFTGRYITERLLDRGRRVRTLTGHPGRSNPFEDRVDVAPLDFADAAGLVRDLSGVDTLYNTYWIRFPRGGLTHERAVANSRTLFGAAVRAGVRRVVHVSITNPSVDSPSPYFRGKALAEEALRGAGVSSGIVRPAVVFGREDILINNIAYVLRRLPLFGIAGSGAYRVRPISVEDVADLCVASAHRDADDVVDAVGPETFTFEELVRLIARTVGSRSRIVHVPASLTLLSASVIGRVVGDVLVTRDELEGLMANRVTTEGPATGTRRLSDWLARNADVVGRSYASEIGRHYRPAA